MSKILVTGGAGFIGSNFVHQALAESQDEIVVLDALTYAGNLENLADVQGDPRFDFVKADITDADAVNRAFESHQPDAVVHMAAESHVDRSVTDATAFVQTNVVGTQVLLDVARQSGVSRFLHVSTDEVYGSLGAQGAFVEDSPIQPNSPYSASKAGSDFLVRAAFETHGMDTVITRCSNNYGPYQFPEKLIPLMISNCFEEEPLPVYGDGKNIRDWIHVSDHCRALRMVLTQGKPGTVYNIGGNSERENLQVVEGLLALTGRSKQLIRFVQDRPGHDRRYAIDGTKIKEELGFTPRVRFEDGLADTVEWYRNHSDWVEHVRSGEYKKYYSEQYGEIG